MSSVRAPAGDPAFGVQKPKLGAGIHVVTISAVREGRDGGPRVELSNESGVAYINLPRELPGKGDFQFWKLAGANDYPSAEFWLTPYGERGDEPIWDTFSTMKDINFLGREFLIEIVPQPGTKYVNVAGMYSLSGRHEKEVNRLREKYAGTGIASEDSNSSGTVSF